jgi:hypothetical protein
LSREPKQASVYKRDPTWAQGLISAARSVAAVVQHLVQNANDAAQGKIELIYLCKLIFFKNRKCF